MPEGDAVWRTARRLDAALSGHVLLRADLRVPAFATIDLAGREVLATVSRGKHLLTRLGPRAGSQDGVASTALTLHTHLRMEGSWRIVEPDQRWPGPAADVRAVLEVPGRAAVGLRLGVVEVVATDDEHEVVGHLGPDLLGPDWDPDEALRRLTADPARPVGEALADQRVLAGLGTIWLAELLFLRGVDPWRPVGDVDGPERLVALAHRLLVSGRDTGRMVTTGDPRPGRALYVYDRAGRPCRRCGTPVLTGRQGRPPQDRVRFWCPSCQPRSPVR